MKKSDINFEDILTDRVIEEDFLEIPLKHSVFRTLFIFISIVVIITIFQLVNLSFVKGDFYKNRALANIKYIETVAAPRGIITDRFGKNLLDNSLKMGLLLSPSELPKNAEERSLIFDELVRVLKVDKSELYGKIKEKDWGLSDRLLLTKDLNHDQVVAISSANMPGVKVKTSFGRSYGDGLALSHLLGFTSLVDSADLKNNKELTVEDEIGRAGLESYYDDYLRGKSGKEIFLKDAFGKIKEKESHEEALGGNKLETFIDGEFQKYFYDSLLGGLRRLGRSSGVGIALNPQNGEVLALLSIPGFDPSSVAKFLKSNDNPLFNRAVSGLYNPGSTIKPLVATAALSSGIIGPEKEILSIGFIEVPNPYDKNNPSRFVDWKAHGWVDLKSALARSSNVYFYEIGGGFEGQIGLGIERLKDWWTKFGLGEKTKIDLPAEESGFLPTPEWKEKTTSDFWRLGDTYNVSIGQGDLLITPIELLNYIAAVANGGKVYKPIIMKRIDDGGGKKILESKPEVLRDLSSEIGAVVGEVQKGMRDAVSKTYGTASLLGDLPVAVAAKTGTAQTNNNTKINAFFVGYAPYENPEIAILVMVENAREGSLNVVPVARDVLMWYYNNRLKK